VEQNTEKPIQQEKELLEIRSQPMRKYLMDKVTPVVAEGVLRICKEMPKDPVEFLVFPNINLSDSTSF